MKRVLLGLTAIAATAAFTPFAAAKQSGPQVVGAGARATDSYVGTNHFAVQVSQSANGVSGVFIFHPDSDPSATFHVDVKCDYITGKVAVIGGVIVDAADPSFVGHGYAVGFMDNGTPQNGVTPDLVTNHDFMVEPGRTPPLTQADCAAEAASGNLANWHLMASGNVQISNAP
jgi:hypothetical protein